jgi:predicted RNA binding protein YcfA (HicA-like mRNA interferase family)
VPQKYPPLTPAEVIEILTAYDFRFKHQVGSHAQYEAVRGGKSYKVTVKTNAAEFNDFLMKSMIRQSGLTREDFYSATKSSARKINSPYKKP